MKQILFNNDEIKVVTNTQARLYHEMNLAIPLFNKDEKELFLAQIDNDIAIEVWEEQMIPEDQEWDEEQDWREWYEKYQRKHMKKYGIYLYI